MSSLTSREPDKTPLDLETVRARLSAHHGKAYWRSLEELAATEEFREFLHREFPRQASTLSPAMDRRSFLTLLGASLALAGLSGCQVRQEPEKIVPYIDQPDGMTPGKPLFFATAMPLGAEAVGLLVTSREGRPIKIEGNPDHPASLGATDAFRQASLLTLYDPGRSQAVLHAGRPANWDDFLGAMHDQFQAMKANGGAGLRVLTETVTSPTLAAQLRALLAQYPAATWHQYEPVGRDNVRAGSQAAFGRIVNALYQFHKADVIVSLDGDFLLTMPGHVRYARDFADGRRVRKNTPDMNRLYAAESSPAITGAMADHRLPLRAGEIDSLARALAQQLSVAGVTASASPLSSEAQQWAAAAAADLQAHRGTGLVVVGDHQPPAVHALAHAMNAALGNAGTTVVHTDPIEAEPIDQAASFNALVQAMQAGQVQTLLILSGNPVYTAPADIDFAGALAKVPQSIHLGLYDDETANLCQWHIPEHHYLEIWSDTRALDGTTTIMQPLIMPLYEGRSAHELLDALLTPPGRSGHDVVKTYWQTQRPGPDFETFWRRSLHDGLVAGSAAPVQTVALAPNFTVPPPTYPLTPSLKGRGTENSPLSRSVGEGPGVRAGSLEINFRPDPTIWDGRFANNGWLQELAKPLSKLTWDNAAILSPNTAARLHLSPDNTSRNGNDDNNVQMVELRYRGRTLKAPVWILPGHPDDCVTITLGYGRTRAGNVGTGAGFNAYALRTSDAPWFGDGLEIGRTGDWYPLACTHTHHTMEGRDLIRVGSIEEFRSRPNDVAHGKGREPDKPPMLLAESPRGEYAWAMEIDNNVCIGCNACVIACQAENNIPIVGKEEVLRGREMHWIRIDRYYTGEMGRPSGTYFMPVPCMQCEKAPCELVCPVDATIHSKDGLNMMVYNRCVGTRYCSNNCPYKVRRFNFLHYAAFSPSLYLAPVVQLMHNPEVTVRSRGVMEKCTYCVQRLEVSKITAEEQNRKVADGEVTPACAQACPTQAIIFGDLNDPNSRVSQAKTEPHDYALLSELNTRPRTTYLARLENPNPALNDQTAG